MVSGNESWVRDGEYVFAERDGVKLKFARGICLNRFRELGIAGGEGDFGVGDGAMLWVMDQAAHSAKDGGQTGCSKKASDCKNRKASHGNFGPPNRRNSRGARATARDDQK